MQLRRMSVLAMFIAGLVLAPPTVPVVDAQEEAEGTLSRIYMFTPKPGMAMEFEAGIKAHIENLAAAGHGWEWWGFSVETGEDTGQYGVVSPGHTLADFAEYDANDREATMASYAEHVAPYVADISSVITRAMPEISKPPTGPFSFVQVIHFNLKADKVDHFRATVQGLHEAFKQGDQSYGWSMPFSGAQGPQMTVALYYDGWEAMPEEEGDMRAVAASVWGEQGASMLMDTLGDSHWGSESWLARMRPDLSYMPESSEGEM